MKQFFERHQYFVPHLVEAVITVVLFALIGQIYCANDHTVLINIIIWLFINTISYFIIMLVPPIRKKTKYVDWGVFSAGLFGIMIYCLYQAKSVDEYSYLSVLSYIAGILSLFDLVSSAQRKNEISLAAEKIQLQYLNQIGGLSFSIQQDIIKLVAAYKQETFFKLRDAVKTLNQSERQTRKIIKSAIACSVIAEEGNTSAKKYRIVSPEDFKSNN